ncbi:MAG: N-formylglutamate amidohydrolase [Marinibacterium sp.]
MDTEPTRSDVVDVRNAQARSDIVLVCEHAGRFIPSDLNDLGLSEAARRSHVAWDPGALGVAAALSARLDAVLFASTVSRLVYDCNRPPHAPDAMPAQSEAYAIPGNANLTEKDRANRADRYYHPFRRRLAEQVANRSHPILVTIHSFTPVYHGRRRDVEIGILHDTDSRLADALLDRTGPHVIRRNEPYGPEDGVTHTLKEHALPGGHLNVMIEIRNDLIETEADQADMAALLARWITDALEKLGVRSCMT